MCVCRQCSWHMIRWNSRNSCKCMQVNVNWYCILCWILLLLCIVFSLPKLFINRAVCIVYTDCWWIIIIILHLIAYNFFYYNSYVYWVFWCCDKKKWIKINRCLCDKQIIQIQIHIVSLVFVYLRNWNYLFSKKTQNLTYETVYRVIQDCVIILLESLCQITPKMMESQHCHQKYQIERSRAH